MRTPVGTCCERLCCRNGSICSACAFWAAIQQQAVAGSVGGRSVRVRGGGSCEKCWAGGWKPNPGDPFACLRSELAGAAGYERSGRFGGSLVLIRSRLVARTTLQQCLPSHSSSASLGGGVVTLPSFSSEGIPRR